MARVGVQLGLLAIALGAGCVQLLGADRDYREVADPGGAGGHAASTSAGGGAQSTHTTTTTSTSTTTTNAGDAGTGGASTGGAGMGGAGTGGAGMGGAGAGGGGGSCRLGQDAMDCAQTERCTLDDPKTGSTKCAPLAPAPTPAYSLCTSDVQCDRGTWCDSDRTGVCKPFCDDVVPCARGSCTEAQIGGQVVPGASACTAHCDPVTADACGPHVTCVWDAASDDTDCFVSQSIGLGKPCGSIGDCDRGLFCTTGGHCGTWCHPAGQTSADCGGGACLPNGDSPTYGGSVYGFCQ
jgi:hypothetical protein